MNYSQKAVQFFVFWSQALQLRTPMNDLCDAAPELEGKLRRISMEIELWDVPGRLSDDTQRVMSMEQEASRFRRRVAELTLDFPPMYACRYIVALNRNYIYIRPMFSPILSESRSMSMSYISTTHHNDQNGVQYSQKLPVYCFGRQAGSVHTQKDKKENIKSNSTRNSDYNVHIRKGSRSTVHGPRYSYGVAGSSSPI